MTKFDEMLQNLQTLDQDLVDLHARILPHLTPSETREQVDELISEARHHLAVAISVYTVAQRLRSPT